MRIRTIKPEFWRSNDINALNSEDRLLFIGLWSYVDDNGVGIDALHIIVAELFAHDHFENPRETVARVSRGLQNIELHGLILRYQVSGKAYLYINTWERHQRIDKPNKPRYPLPDADRESLATSSRESRETPAPGTGEQGNRGTGEQTSPNGEVARTKRAPTTAGERIPDPFILNTDMREWARHETPGLDAEASTRAFVDHWRSVPGARGKKLDWLATWRNWLRKDWKDTQPRRGHLQAVRPNKDQRAADVIRMGQELQAAQDHNDLTGLDFLDLKALPE